MSVPSQYEKQRDVPALVTANSDDFIPASARDEKDLPSAQAPVVDGHAILHEAGVSGGAAAIIKGDVARKLTTFERKAALINA